MHSRLVLPHLIVASLGVTLLAGCPKDDPPPADAAPADAATADAATADATPPPPPDATVPPDANGPVGRKIDILFLVDNSGSMGQEQVSLANNFPQFMSVLNAIPGGLPDVHIGVISSNTGVGGYNITGCGGDGDGGKLQNLPRVPGCTPPTDAFISDVLAEDGTTRVRNYEGSLEETFGCISQLGTAGCGFEQHLESMKRALDGSNPENAGFLRADAYLAVIIIADEDDCSAADTMLFDPNDTSLTGTLGPLSSFRCAEFGLTCAEGNLSRTAGAYSECRPRTDSFLRDPMSYVEFLKSLKSDPNRIMVSGIIGNPDPVRVKLNSRGEPEMDFSCVDPSGENGAAAPGVRLKAVLDQFPNSTATSICNADLSTALLQIAERLAVVVGP